MAQKKKTGEEGAVRVRDRIKRFDRVRCADLLANPLNWRQHSEGQKAAMSGILAEVGMVDALLVRERGDGTYEIIDGHMRAGMMPGEMVPVLVLDVTPEEATKILLTFDPISAMATANAVNLDALLREVEFSNAALQALVSELADSASLYIDEATAAEIVEDEAPEPPADPITKPGDLWILGTHRVLCGDSTKADDVARLMVGQKSQLIHADPPYGMGKENEGVQNDNLYGDKLDAFQMAWWNAARPHTEDNGSAYIWGNSEGLWRLWYVGGLRDAERLTFRSFVIWNKPPSGMGDGQNNPVMRSFGVKYESCLFFMLGEQGFNNNADNYWAGWEPIRLYLESEMNKCGGQKKWKEALGNQMGGHYFTRSQWSFPTKEAYEKLQAFAKGNAFKREHDELKREHDELKREHDELKQQFYETRAYFDNTHDNMTDVWDFPRVTGEDRHGHATPKPVAMICRAIKSSTAESGLVYEPFLGSGTTLIAAEQLNRKCYGMEISPAYCDVIVKRWETLTGKTAMLEG